MRQLPVRLPDLVRRFALVQLFRATAAAFEREMPSLRRLSPGECLELYARGTAAWAAEALSQPDDLPNVQGRLFRNAYRLGRLPGRLLAVADTHDVMLLGRALYGVLNIDFEGNHSGEIVIGCCYFSRFYSPDICRVMSAMDRGLLAGLAGGGDLVFSERITEGRLGCRARFTPAAGQASLRLSGGATR